MKIYMRIFDVVFSILLSPFLMAFAKIYFLFIPDSWMFSKNLYRPLSFDELNNKRFFKYYSFLFSCYSNLLLVLSLCLYLYITYILIVYIINNFSLIAPIFPISLDCPFSLMDISYEQTSYLLCLGVKNDYVNKEWYGWLTVKNRMNTYVKCLLYKKHFGMYLNSIFIVRSSILGSAFELLVLLWSTVKFYLPFTYSFLLTLSFTLFYLDDWKPSKCLIKYF